MMMTKKKKKKSTAKSRPIAPSRCCRVASSLNTARTARCWTFYEERNDFRGKPTCVLAKTLYRDCSSCTLNTSSTESEPSVVIAISGCSILYFLMPMLCVCSLKPQNVLISSSGNAKLADFGLAHVKQSGASAPRPYGVCGTKCFVAPEVLRNDRYGVAADVFSLGVILCQVCECIDMYMLPCFFFLLFSLSNILMATV